MPVTIELDGERATWDGEKWTSPDLPGPGGPLARLGNQIATEPPTPSDPAGLETARKLAAQVGATISEVGENEDRFPLVY